MPPARRWDPDYVRSPQIVAEATWSKDGWMIYPEELLDALLVRRPGRDRRDLSAAFILVGNNYYVATHTSSGRVTT